MNLQRKSEVAAAKHQQLVKLNRLASLRPDFEFGLGTELLEGGASLAKRFLGGAVGTGIKSALKTGAVGSVGGAALGGVAGAGHAIVHNLIDSDPNDHESVLGGALHGAGAGAAIGGTIGAGASLLKTAPSMAEEITGGGMPKPPAPGMSSPASRPVSAAPSVPNMAGASPSPGGSDPSGGGTPWWKKYNQTSPSQPQTVNASSRRSTINFGASYEDIVLHKFAELRAAGVPEVNAKSQAFDFGVKRHSSAYVDFRKRGGTVDFSLLRAKSPGGINTEEVASGVPSGQMLPATSGQSQPIYDEAQTVATRRIAGVAESAQGDIDPQDPWSDSRAVNITNNPEFMNCDRDAETQRILAKIHRLNGRKAPGRLTASM